MSRTLKILAWTIGVLIVLPLLLITLVISVANIDWGRRLAEHMTAQFSGGNVVLTGLSGHFPYDLRYARVVVRQELTSSPDTLILRLSRPRSTSPSPRRVYWRGSRNFRMSAPFRSRRAWKVRVTQRRCVSLSLQGRFALPDKARWTWSVNLWTL